MKVLEDIAKTAKAALFAGVLTVSGCFGSYSNVPESSGLYASGYALVQDQTKEESDFNKKTEHTPRYKALVSVFPDQEKYNQNSEEDNDILDNLTWSVKLGVLF